MFFFFFSSRRRHTRFSRDWSSDVCSSDLRRVELGSVERSDAEADLEPAAPDHGGPESPHLDVRWDEVVLAAHVALQGPEIDLAALVPAVPVVRRGTLAEVHAEVRA